MAVDLQDVKARVGEVSGLTKVNGVVNAAHALATSSRPGAAFVAVSSERAAPNKTSGAHRQKVDCQIAVLLCLAAQQAADDVPDDAEAIRIAVRDHLTGWRPAGAERNLDYASYSVIRLGGGLVWLQLLFTTNYKLNA